MTRPPHLAGCYTTRALAMAIAGRLEASGLPTGLQECDHVPRACIAIDKEDGHPAAGPVTPPVSGVWNAQPLRGYVLYDLTFPLQQMQVN